MKQLEQLAIFLSSAIILGAVVTIFLFCFQRKYDREKQYKSVIPYTITQIEHKESLVEIQNGYTDEE